MHAKPAALIKSIYSIITSTPPNAMTLAQWSTIRNGQKVISAADNTASATIVACYSNSRPAVLLPLLILMNHPQATIAVIVHSETAMRRYKTELKDTALSSGTACSTAFVDKWQTTQETVSCTYFTPLSFLSTFSRKQDLNYTYVVFLDTHERSQWGETALTIIKRTYKGKLVLGCVPLSPALQYLQSYFKDASVVALEDFEAPDIHYLEEASSDLDKSAVQAAVSINSLEDAGHILVLMPTQKEVSSVIRGIHDRLQSLGVGGEVSVVPFHKEMRREELEQLYEALDKQGGRVIIVATMLAQDYTQLPSGIKYVVDSGLSTCPEGVVWATKQDCEIRANRISAPASKVYRLFTEQTYEQLLDMPPAQLDIGPLDEVIAYWFALGVRNISSLDVPTKLPTRLLPRSLSLLHHLGIVTEDCELTPATQRISSLILCCPFISVRFTAALAHSLNESCQTMVLSIVAMLLEGGLNEAYYTPKDKREKEEAKSVHAQFEVVEGELITLLNVYDASCVPKLKPVRWFVEHYINHKMLQRVAYIRGTMGSLIGIGHGKVGAHHDEQLASCLQILKRYLE